MNANLFQTIRRPMYGKGAKVSYTATAGNSATIPPGISAIVVVASSVAWCRIGVSPTAVAGDYPLITNVPVVLPVEAEGSQISVVRDTADGSFYWCPLAE